MSDWSETHQRTLQEVASAPANGPAAKAAGAALAEIARLRAERDRLIEAWRESWDCSRDPGHKIMNEAIAAGMTR